MNGKVTRPLLTITGSFCISLWITPYISAAVKLILAALFALSAIGAMVAAKILGSRSGRIRGGQSTDAHFSAAACLGAVFLAALSASAALTLSYIREDVIYDKAADRLDGVTARCTARITEVIGTTGYSGIYSANVTGIGEETTNIKVRLNADTGELEAGDVINGDFTFVRLRGVVNGFDEQRYCLSKGMKMSAECSDCEITGSDRSGLLFSRLNGRLAGRIVSLFGRDAGGLAAALLLGNKKYLDPGITFDFRMLGISHILALSGLHLTLLSGIALKILKWLKVPRKLRLAADILLIIMYAALTGFPASVCRSGIMLVIALIGEIVGRRSDPMTSLCTAASIILIARPFGVYDIGLQLSFVCVFTIIVLNSSGVLNRHIFHGSNPFARVAAKTIHFAAATVVISVFTSLATLPLMSLAFGEVSVVSPAANLIFIPLVTVLLWVLTVSLPICILFPALSAVPVGLCRFIIYAAENMSKAFGKTVSLQYPFAPYILILVALSLLAAAVLKKEKRRSALKCTVCLVLLFAGLIIIRGVYLDGTIEVTTANYNKSDAIVVTEGTSCILIDISDGSFSAARAAVEEMNLRCVTEIDTYVLTHLHQRHIKTFSKLCDTVRISRLVLPLPVSDTDKSVYESLTYSAEKNEIPVFVYDRDGSSFSIGDSLDFEYGGYMIPSGTTHPVVSFTLTSEDKTIVYLGSSFEKGELFRKGAFDGAILGVHGPVSKDKPDLSEWSVPFVFTSDDCVDRNVLPSNLKKYEKFRMKIK